MPRIILVCLIAVVGLAVWSCTSVETNASGNSPQAATAGSPARISLSDADRAAIGQKIWQNECAGKVEGLTSWNQGEDFPSLGIGHFIWYVKGRPGPFDESFPTMIRHLQARGHQPPAVALSDGSPWTTRSGFLAAQQSPQMKELRQFLAKTVSDQTGFIIIRLEKSLSKMKAATANPADQQRLEKNFYHVANSRAGMYALIDYVNFKGEGTKATERYKGQGWGLRDVLLDMQASDGAANYQFAEAAKRTLTRRVKNSPPERNEARWLKGWSNRCDSYKKGI